MVRLTGCHMSLLVFLYYLIIIACALTLETRALYAICAVISLAFCAVLPLDPIFVRGARAHVGHVLLFLFSVWGVGDHQRAGAAQIQAAERRLMSSVRTQRAIAEENAKLSVDLARSLEESRALTAPSTASARRPGGSPTWSSTPRRRSAAGWRASSTTRPTSCSPR